MSKVETLLEQPAKDYSADVVHKDRPMEMMMKMMIPTTTPMMALMLAVPTRSISIR